VAKPQVLHIQGPRHGLKGWSLHAQPSQAFPWKVAQEGSPVTSFTTRTDQRSTLLMVTPQTFLGVSPALERHKEHLLLFDPARPLWCLHDKNGCIAAKRRACVLTAPGFRGSATTWWPVGACVVSCCDPSAAALTRPQNCSYHTCYAAWQQV